MISRCAADSRDTQSRRIALVLLRDAFGHGADWADHRFYLHLWPEFRGMRKDPEFMQLLVPAG